ncbi:glycosyltransferase involved in cell wall biosynthesis [Motilibacter peucedani]|uniref:Glycosyltransferase involved in cell wall biosynthesis n=1 Tax=Motilibacter peucedani TaxID=598650 RepID=A0A420XU93_9ACTN|nr:glycosyltransferase family 4 protein [Motilibacter peucedani]RKS80301.1 glycosyltransferase involved in cell wall biosynthesis [Motilibacter peucedani]
MTGRAGAPLVVVSNYSGGIRRYVWLAAAAAPGEVQELDSAGPLPAKVRRLRRLLHERSGSEVVVTHGVAAGVAARLRGRRHRESVHVEFWHGDPFFLSPRKRVVFDAARRVGRAPDLQVFVHEGLRPLYADRSVRSVVLPNTVPLAEAASGQRERVVLYLGRYSAEKGVEDLLAAWRLLGGPSTGGPAAEGWRLQLHGDGDLPGGDPAGSPALRVGGPTEDPLAELARASLLVVPSHAECSPYVALEALASATPLVATSVGDLPETAGSSGAGWLVDPREPAALAASIAAATAVGDAELRRRGELGRAWLARSRPFDAWSAAVSALYAGEAP